LPLEGDIMKSGILYLLAVLLVLGGDKAFANGGPIDVSCSLGSGNICLLREEDILLRSECLTIVPVGDWVEVHAVYILENTGPAKLVEYGFPLEVSENEFSGFYHSVDKEPTIRILDGAMPLSVEVLTVPGRVDAAGMDSYIIDGNVKWFTTSLSFQQGETKTVSVHARVLSSYEDFSTTKGFLPSYSSRYFRYSLDPAGYWGCGTAGEMEMAVDFSWVTENGGEVEDLIGPGEWLTDNIYGFNSVDFMLDGAGIIEFQYSVDRWKLARLIEDNTLPSWQFGEISVSSELPEQEGHEYDYRNMFDGDPATAWAEGAEGDGTGEWIEVELPEAYGLGSIAVVNGYQSSREAYEANGRAAEILCTVYFSNGYTETYTIDLEDLNWDEVSSDPCRGYQEIFDAGMPEEADKFRLEILSVYPGSIYSDMCINECIILGNPGGVWAW